MRFMLLLKASRSSEAGTLPSNELIQEMMEFNEKLVNSGVLVAGEGLQASSKGARVRISSRGRTVVDGPFTETKELIAGFWILNVKSRQEAIDWALRSPHPHPGEDAEIEVRQLFDPEDFSDAPPELLEKERALRERVKP